VLVRLTWNSLQMTTDDKPIDWMKLFKMRASRDRSDMPVRVHKGA